jgi:hypothetical protein
VALSTVAFLIPERPRLLLEACLLAPPQRLEAWQHWLHLTRFDDVDIASFDLLPAVCHFNRGQPFAEMDRLRGLFRHNWAINQERLSAVLPLLNALQTEGFEPIPIKGVALAFTTYGSLGARRIADVDVLVDEDRFMGAAALAARLGFEPASGWIWPRAGLKSWPFRGPRGVEVDLHARPLEEPWDAESRGAMLDSLNTVSIGHQRLKTLSPAASLVVALMHGLRHDARGHHHWVLDAALLIRQGGVDWNQVLRLARLLDLGRALSSGLRTVSSFLPAESLPPVPIPAGPHPVREAVEHHFRTRAPGGLSGALPNLFFLYQRERRAGLWDAGFPEFLRAVWQVPDEMSLTAVVVEKAGRRVASGLGRA